jgi:hypothetical protein
MEGEMVVANAVPPLRTHLARVLGEEVQVVKHLR